MESEVEKAQTATWVLGLARWKAIGHFTFAWEASMNSAIRCFEKFMRKTLPGVQYFYTAENNPNRPGYHLHALLGQMSVKRKQVWRQWFDQYGRCRLEPIRGEWNAAVYCAKYVSKELAWFNTNVRPKHDPKWKGTLGETA